MANSLNAFHGEGILGIDAIKNENGGRASVFFTLGMQRSWKNQNTGEWESRMDWVPVVYSRSASDKLVAALTKSTPVRIYGRIESYQKEIGDQKITQVQVRAEDIEFLPRFNRNGGNNGEDGGQASAPKRPQRQTVQRQQRPSRRRYAVEYDDEGDDDEGWSLNYDEE